MAEGIESKPLTLGRVCAIGKSVLGDYRPFAVLTGDSRAEPIHDSYSGDVVTESIVRLVTMRVLDRLAALPVGTWTTPPQTFTIGGVEQQAIYKGNIALSFRLQFDSSSLQTVLHVGGYIAGGNRGTGGDR